MKPDFEKITCDPPFSQWLTIASENKGAIKSIQASISGCNAADVGRAIADVAVQYTLELEATAQSVGFKQAEIVDRSAIERVKGELQSSPPFTFVTGHQPIVYHSGILYKNYLLNRSVHENKASGLNVIIDTDEGDGGEFFLPIKSGAEAAIKRVSLSTSTGVFASQKVKSSEFLKELAAETANFHRPGLSRALEMYQTLANADLCKANAIVRRSFEEKPAYLEVPLSRLVCDQKIRSAWEALVPDVAKWHQDFNSKLSEFRAARKISNRANPFPDLKTSEQKFEMPFWIHDAQNMVRNPFFATRSLSEAGSSLLVPRAVLITLFLRIFGGSFFIHGTGGAKYDLFTDELISHFYGSRAPRFATVSASRYLYESERGSYEVEKNRHVRRREILFHPEKYLGDELFKSSTKTEIEKLSSSKKMFIEQVKSGKSRGESTAQATQEIKGIERRIRQLVEAEFGEDTFKEPQQRWLDSIYFREFPYFMFGS